MSFSKGLTENYKVQEIVENKELYKNLVAVL